MPHKRKFEDDNDSDVEEIQKKPKTEYVDLDEEDDESKYDQQLLTFVKAYLPHRLDAFKSGNLKALNGTMRGISNTINDSCSYCMKICKNDSYCSSCKLEVFLNQIKNAKAKIDNSNDSILEKYNNLCNEIDEIETANLDEKIRVKTIKVEKLINRLDEDIGVFLQDG